MKYTGYLIFEITRDCNLGHLHARCPNMHPQRYGSLPADEPLTDAQIVNVAQAMYMQHGFRGRVGWHYYNEPLMAADRMWRLMDLIDARIPQAAYTLWTNGTLLPEDCSEFRRFEEIHVTDYHLPEHPVKNITKLIAVQRKTRIHDWGLDDRLNAIGDEVSYAPCRRMFTEFILDYYGNVHLCCFDWQGRGGAGNVHETSTALLVTLWQELRRRLIGPRMLAHAPDVCLRCKMRSVGIPYFVPEVARDARRYVQMGDDA